MYLTKVKKLKRLFYMTINLYKEILTRKSFNASHLSNSLDSS